MLSSTVGANFSAPNFNSFLGKLNTPQYQEWSVQIEQQLDSKSSLSLLYVGNHGIHIPVYNTPNLFGSGIIGVPSTPYNPSFAYVGEIYSGAVSNYDGATVCYDRRLAYGLQV